MTSGWKVSLPFSAILAGDQAAIAKFSEHDWTEIVAATHAGMSTEEFLDIAAKWLATARHPVFKRSYTELIYQPMLEVMQYLRANGFRTYIVSAGGQEFVRTYAQRVYGIPPEQVVGSSIVTDYEVENGKPALMRLPRLFLSSTARARPPGSTSSSASDPTRLSATPWATAKCWSGRASAMARG